MLKMLLISLVLLKLVSAAVLTQPATWIADPNFAAGSATLITSITSAPIDNFYDVYYTRAMISNPPNIAVGIKSYKGDDFLVQQFFRLLLGVADQSKFTLQLILVPITTPIIFQISYLAVETTYPYLNALPPIDFGGGSLSNFSTMSSTMQTQTQVIDYQHNEYFYSNTVAPPTFSTPFSRNVFAFYLTTLYITSTNDVIVQLDVSYTILDASTYQMTVTAGKNLTITNLAFSKIVYDASHFSLGARDYLTAYDWKITTPTLSTNFFSLPPTIYNNQLIVGLKSFTSSTGQSKLIFQWSAGPYSSTYGVLMAPSTTFTSYSPQVLYYLKWTCPVGYPYTNFTSFLCQDSCPPYYYPDPVDLVCRPCNNTRCYTCNNTNTNICTSCDTNFVLNSGDCECDMGSNSKILISDNTCYICSNLLSNCILCDYTGNNSLSYNSSEFTCLDCDSSANYFLNAAGTCSYCTATNCITCASMTTCKVCVAGYGTNSSKICSTCPIDYCATCYNLTACKVCSSPYLLMPNYTCSSCAATCTCDGYTFPRKINGDCSTICGDGIIISTYQGCDDNNTLDGDGCSSTCQVQANSKCTGTPSICYYNGSLSAKFVSTAGVIDNCNQIVFTFQIVPYLLFFRTYAPFNWSQLITANSKVLTYVPDSFNENQGLISLTYTYTQTIHKTTVDFTFTPSALSSKSPYLNKTTPFNLSAFVDPKNYIAAVFCSDELLSSTSPLTAYLSAQNSIAYIGLFLSIFSLKIVGLEMFGALQLSYLILSDYDYINPVFRQILGRNEVNGINAADASTGNPLMSYRVTYNGYTSQIFLQNFNVMFYITLGLVIGGFAMYSITYFLNKTIQASNLIDSLKEKEQQSVRSQNLNSKLQEQQAPPKSAWFHRLSKYILKEVLMTFVIFNMFNMSFSAGLQMKYVNVVQPGSIIAMLVSFILVIALMIAQVITDKLEFGEYIDKFNKETSQSNYMIVTIIYRFTLGLLMALLNQWNSSGIVFTFVSGAFLTYIFYCEPFVDQIQNVRSKAVHSVHVLMMFINYYYRQEANFDQVGATQFLFPAYLQVVVVGLVVFASTFMLGYEVFMKIKTTFFSSKEAVDQTQNIFSNMQVQNNAVQQIQTQEVEQIEG